MKTFILILFVLVPFSSFSQKTMVGGEIGALFEGDFFLPEIGCTFEYSFNNSQYSISADLKYALFLPATLPIYLNMKVSAGNRTSLGPFLGGFINTSSGYGLAGGVNFDFLMRKKTVFFIKAEFNKDFSSNNDYGFNGQSYLLNLGVKKEIFSKKK